MVTIMDVLPNTTSLAVMAPVHLKAKMYNPFLKKGHAQSEFCYSKLQNVISTKNNQN